MTMADDHDANLGVLMAHAWWTRDAAWTRSWFTEFFTPLITQGFLLPPLLAYDLRSAAERGDRRRGAKAGKRNNGACWDAFMTWAHNVCAGSLSPAQSARSDRRTESSNRLAKSISASLMDQVDISALRRKDGVLDPRGLLRLESKRLDAGLPHDVVLRDAWKLIEGAVAKQRFFELAAISECLPFPGRNGDELDPFLPKLLGVEANRDQLREPQIRGTNPRADNPRVVLAPTGEFAKRDLGGMPSDLGRLAPTELLMLRESGAGPRGGRLGSRRVAFRTLFLYRAINGQLLQRYSRSVKPAEMEPVVHVQVDLVDTPESHRLSDPPNPPVISWYRALAVQLVHTLARLSKPFRWDVTFRVQCGEEANIASVILPASLLGELGGSKQRALELIVARLPEAFASRRGVRREAYEAQNVGVPEVDLWLRVVLGARDSYGGESFLRQRPPASHERGIRVERLRNGDYGLAVSNSAADAHLLHLDPSRRSTSPTAVAKEVVSELLGESHEETETWQM